METMLQSSSRAVRRVKRTHGGCPARFRHSLQSVSATPLMSLNSNSFGAFKCKLPLPQQQQQKHRQYASFHFCSSSNYCHRLRSSRHPAWQFLERRGFATKDNADTSASVVVDYFDLFGLPRTFGIDASKLKQTYLKLMTEHHPDKQLHRPATDTPNRDTRTDVTAETITHAYQILTAPHTRAQHWLELHGSPLVDDSPPGGSDDHEEAAFANSQNLVGMEFLLEILEWREAIEDAGSDQAKLQAISQETQGLHQTCERALEDLLEGLAGIDENDKTRVAMDDATLEDARQLTAQLQYWHRLERTLKDAMDVG